jgi:hypothetical protein
MGLRGLRLIRGDVQGSAETRAMTSKEEWYAFADRLIALTYAIFGEAKMDITEKLFGEPKILSLALLCRTVGNFKGAMILAKQGLGVEARTLTRSCYENLFCLGGLIERGDDFVEAMHHSQIRSFRMQGEFLLDDLNPADIGDSDFVDQLRTRLDDMKSRWPKAKLLSPKQAAEESVLRKAYLIYSKLSVDAAHPSILALKRHLVRGEENGEQWMALDVNPLENGTEITETIDFACNAMIGACVAVNQILDGLSVNDEIRTAFIEYGRLSGTCPTT